MAVILESGDSCTKDETDLMFESGCAHNEVALSNYASRKYAPDRRCSQGPGASAFLEWVHLAPSMLNRDRNYFLHSVRNQRVEASVCPTKFISARSSQKVSDPEERLRFVAVLQLTT